jgi:hypothetical protein
MNGATPVAEVGLPNPGGDWQIISAGDFNHDGNSDLLFRSASANQSAIWLMNGTQVKAESQPQADISSAASASALASPLSSGPVLYSSEFFPSGASGASDARLAGTGSLSEQQLATPLAGVGSLHLTQA